MLPLWFKILFINKLFPKKTKFTKFFPKQYRIEISIEIASIISENTNVKKTMENQIFLMKDFLICLICF